MRKAALIVLVVSALLASASCVKSPTTPDVNKLLGKWRATAAEYMSFADLQKRVDIVSQGSTVILELTENDFTLTVTDPGKTPAMTTGTWTSTSDTMTLAPAGESSAWVFLMSQTSQSLSLSGAHVQFDFGSGLEEAILSLVLARG